MSFKLELELPGLPRMVNPSGRPMHWAIRAKEARKWKRDVSLAVIAAGPAPIRFPLKRARLEFTRFSSVEPDFDGLVSGFKWIQDALVHCGVLENDRMSNIGQPRYHWKRVPRGRGKIRIVLIPVPPEQGELDGI
jgi:hypothetical protein